VEIAHAEFMGLTRFAESYARKLGLWVDPHTHQPLSLGLVNGDLRLETWARADHPGADECITSVDIDPGTALVLTHALATGLRLHVGRCPACVERGDGWEYRRRIRARPGRTLPDTWVRVHGPLLPGRPRVWVRPCPECSEPGPEVECDAPGCQDSARAAGVDGGWPSCKACRGSGKVPGPPQPSGQRWLDTVEWVLACVARVCELCGGHGCFSGEDDGLDDCVPVHVCADCDGGTVPPDPDVRAAASVLADRMQASGDPWGTVLAAWLAGKCPTCKGSGARSMHAGSRAAWLVTCSACHGEGTVLGAMLDQVVSAVDVGASPTSITPRTG
jgi:hypothetical protein